MQWSVWMLRKLAPRRRRQKVVNLARFLPGTEAPCIGWGQGLTLEGIMLNMAFVFHGWFTRDISARLCVGMSYMEALGLGWFTRDDSMMLLLMQDMVSCNHVLGMSGCPEMLFLLAGNPEIMLVGCWGANTLLVLLLVLLPLANRYGIPVEVFHSWIGPAEEEAFSTRECRLPFEMPLKFQVLLLMLLFWVAEPGIVSDLLRKGKARGNVCALRASCCVGICGVGWWVIWEPEAFTR